MSTNVELKNTGITVLKPKCDNRDYEFFTLPNNMDVLLVSDPKSDTAAAALAVGVGSLSDPKEALGLFHFMEHMLFMGSSKFKSETDYPNYIASHGGMSNAWTAATETVYYFDIDANFLDGALDRFSQFFISPLFDPASTDRELNAVHSEHDKNVYNDAWRAWDSSRFVMNEEHPAAWFHTGNLTTLKEEPLKHGTDVRALVLSNYKEKYSANLMKLCIVGKESLSDLKKKAITHFAQVKDTNKPTPTFSTDVLRDAFHVVELSPIKQQRSMDINFILPSDLSYIDTQPLNILSHCFGDEGPKSILSLLKAKRWATGLSSGRQTRAEFGCMFSITIDLTEAGVANLHDIARIVYAGIDIMGKKSDAEWERMANEAKAIDQLNFDNRENSAPSDTVTTIVGTMFTHKPANIVQGEAVLQVVNVDHIRKFLPFFKLENCWFTVRSPDTTRDIKLFSDEVFGMGKYEELAKVGRVAEFEKEEMACAELNTHYTSKEWVYNQYYKNRYTKYPLSEKLRQYVMAGLNDGDVEVAQKNEPLSYADCTTPSSLIDLVAPNPFIPSNSDLLVADDADKVATTQEQKTKGHPKSVYICSCHSDRISSLPLTLDTATPNASDYKNSVLDTNFYGNVASVNPGVKQPTNVAELKTLITQLVQNNLIGFDSTHFNTGIGDDKVVSQKDALTEDVVKALFARTDETYGKSLPPAVASTKTAVEQGQDGGDDEDAEGDEDEDDGEEGGEEQGEVEEEEGEKGGSTKLWTVDSFFNEKDEKSITQFLPPVQIPIPIPTSHFPISQARAGGADGKGIKISSTPIVPPIECYYKFIDAYQSPNVQIVLRIELPGINDTFLALFTRALNDFLSEKLYGALLCNIQKSVIEGQNSISINVTGHRQGAAETFNVLLEALFNPLLFNVDLFNRVMDKYQRALLSVPMSAAYQQCSVHNSAITNKNVKHTTQKFEDLVQFKSNMDHFVSLDYFKKHVANAQFLVMGNVTKPYTIRLAQNTAITLELKESLMEDLFAPAPIIFPDGINNIALLKNGNPLDNQNGLLTTYLTLEPFRAGFARTNALVKMKERGMYKEPVDEKGNLDLNLIENGQIFNKMTFYGNVIYNYIISHLMSDHSFDSLRTKQQLGYIAQSRHHFNLAGYGLGFIVQSSHPIHYVDQRIEYYMRKELKDYISSDPKCIANDAAYITNLAGAQKGLLQRFTALDAETGFFTSSIFARSYDWYRQLVLGLMVPYIHRHVILGYYNKWFLDLSQRRKLGIHVGAQTGTGAWTEGSEVGYQEFQDQNVMTDLNQVLGLKDLLPSVRF